MTEFDKAAYANRVASLRNPPALTDGIELEPGDKTRCQQENQYVGIPRNEWLKMPEKLQRLLGFQKVNFLYGSVDYTDPLTYYLSHPD